MHGLLALDSVVFGTSHPYFASHLENLGFVYRYAGFPDSTKLVTRRAFEIRRANLADDNPAIGRSLFNLAALEYDAGSYRRRRAALRGGGVSDAARVRARKHRCRLGDRCDGQKPVLPRPHGRSRAEPALVARRDRPRRTARSPPSTPGSAGCSSRCWWTSVGGTEAEPLALRVLAIQDSLKDTLARASAEQLAKIYEGTGRHDLAAKYLKRSSP